MAAKLNKELAESIHTARDSETHLRSMEALRKQQDRDAIAEGLVQMEAGLGKPLDQALADMRAQLGLSQAQ